MQNLFYFYNTLNIESILGGKYYNFLIYKILEAV